MKDKYFENFIVKKRNKEKLQDFSHYESYFYS